MFARFASRVLFLSLSVFLSLPLSLGLLGRHIESRNLYTLVWQLPLIRFMQIIAVQTTLAYIAYVANIVHTGIQATALTRLCELAGHKRRLPISCITCDGVTTTITTTANNHNTTTTILWRLQSRIEHRQSHSPPRHVMLYSVIRTNPQTV